MTDNTFKIFKQDVNASLEETAEFCHRKKKKKNAVPKK